ncbi:hypothetical protein HLH33_16695 [Gluconacetobacter diazotrophicus]|uniref:Uncharacterized protein n=1 Tax=Gluconacetobacter diazotrophicus TaxID=33996 RepID=A0A7W4NHL4_GLUDI|nr:hypothetical protein [Gluconacetobacter diazotrophicus]MBB2157919.1 hypothetical protein [Gluconacetobacter diazotrophicus]
MADIESTNLHAVAGHKVESCVDRNGNILIRTPDILPVNARYWHGPYETVEAALADFARRIAAPRITAAELNSLKHHGYYGVVNGVPTIMRLCRWTGASTLTPFELVAAGGRGHARS